MSVRVFYDILNQKGTPAMYTDTLANRPTFGFAGRLFISTDSGQIFEDTGSAWTLVADAGVGGGTLSSVCLNGNTTASGIVITAGGLSSNSITNTGITEGSVLFAGASGLESQSNATFFWDNTNKRLGIGNASPGAPLDIHGTGTQIQVNGTGSNNSYIQFQNAGVSKWRIGNTYNGAANTFDLYNNSLTSTALSFNVTTNAATFNNSITATSLIKSGGTSTQFLKADGSIDSNTYLTTSGASSTYLPLSGGSLTGNLATNSYISIQNGLGTNQIYLTKSSGDVYGTIQTEAGGNKFSLGNVSNIGTLGTPNITWTSGAQVGINNSSPTYDFDVTGGLRSTTASYLATASGNVGIGSTSPLSKLHVVSALGTIIRIGEQSGTTGKQMLFGIDATTGRGEIQAVWQGTANTPLGLNVAGGNVLIGTTTDNGNKLQVNGTGYFAGNVGIGTSSPNTILNLKSSTTTELRLESVGGTYRSFIGFRTDGQKWDLGVNLTDVQDALSFNYAASEKMRITSGGNALIGTTTDRSDKLQVQGDIVAQNTSGSGIFSRATSNTTTYGFYNNGSGSLILTNSGVANVGTFTMSTGVYVAISDINKKKDFEQSSIGLYAILNLKPILYRMKTENNTEKHLGFIAQEVKKFIPQAYVEQKDFIGLDYNSIIAALVKAIQQLNEKLVKNNIN